jgi:Predicted membrane protein
MTDYFTYEGRLNRWPYFKRMAVYCGVYLLIWIVMTLADYENGIGIIIFMFLILLSIPFHFVGFVFVVMQSIQRLHDLNKSGWYLLIILVVFIPLIGGFIVLGFELYLLLIKGTTGPNRFGPDPLGGEAGNSNYPVQSLNSEVVDAEYEEDMKQK